MICDICDGLGEYPIINSRGRHVYNITCPECYGSSEIDEPSAPSETLADLFTAPILPVVGGE